MTLEFLFFFVLGVVWRLLLLINLFISLSVPYFICRWQDNFFLEFITYKSNHYVIVDQ